MNQVESPSQQPGENLQIEIENQNLKFQLTTIKSRNQKSLSELRTHLSEKFSQERASLERRIEEQVLQL